MTSFTSPLSPVPSGVYIVPVFPLSIASSSYVTFACKRELHLAERIHPFYRCGICWLIGMKLYTEKKKSMIPLRNYDDINHPITYFSFFLLISYHGLNMVMISWVFYTVASLLVSDGLKGISVPWTSQNKWLWWIHLVYTCVLLSYQVCLLYVHQWAPLQDTIQNECHHCISCTRKIILVLVLTVTC